MAKVTKEKKPKGRPKQYESSNVAVKGTFEDMIKASLKPKSKNN